MASRKWVNYIVRSPGGINSQPYRRSKAIRLAKEVEGAIVLHAELLVKVWPVPCPKCAAENALIRTEGDRVYLQCGDCRKTWTRAHESRKRGRPTIGKTAMTGAERTAKWRANKEE